MKLRQSCRKQKSSKAGDLVALLCIACRRHMLPIKHELCTASTSLTHRTSRQRRTKQNQKYPGTHQRKRRECCRKYSIIKAGDLIVVLRIAYRREILPNKHKLHATTTKWKIPWNSPNKDSSILQEIQHHQCRWVCCTPAHSMQTSNRIKQTQNSRNTHTAHALYIKQNSYKTTKQNQKYPGTHQIQSRESYRKYSTIKAGDFVVVLRIACRRHMLPIKHKLHTTSTNRVSRTSSQRHTKERQNDLDLTKPRSNKPAGNSNPARLVIAL